MRICLNEKPLQLLKGNAARLVMEDLDYLSSHTFWSYNGSFLKINHMVGRQKRVVFLNLDILCHFKALAYALKDRMSSLFKENCIP